MLDRRTLLQALSAILPAAKAAEEILDDDGLADGEFSDYDFDDDYAEGMIVAPPSGRSFVYDQAGADITSGRLPLGMVMCEMLLLHGSTTAGRQRGACRLRDFNNLDECRAERYKRAIVEDPGERATGTFPNLGTLDGFNTDVTAAIVVYGDMPVCYTSAGGFPATPNGSDITIDFGGPLVVPGW